MQKRWKFLVASCLCVTLLVGCETLSFYGQAIRGQLEVLAARDKIDGLLADPTTGGTQDAALRAQLTTAQSILAYAREHLAIEPGGRYSSYADIGRDAVVWNVFASQADRVFATQWCYPIVGCAPYRGYFSEQRALEFAAQLEADGLQTYVGGVPAYSTLGWFDDPILNTFVDWPEADLANLLIHELAHGVVWVSGDVAFNESFATFVAREGMRGYFDGREADLEAWQVRRANWVRLRSMLLELKTSLEVEGLSTQQVADAYAGFNLCYQDNLPRLGGGRYDELVAAANNAFLVSLGTYEDWVGAFAELYREAVQQDRNDAWPLFYAAVERIGQMSSDERRTAMMERLAQHQVDQRRDHSDPDQVHCETLTSHGRDRKSAG